VFALGDVTATSVEQALEPVKGHRMAKAALQTAVLDADLRAAAGESPCAKPSAPHSPTAWWPRP
jgi:hypothetical protein